MFSEIKIKLRLNILNVFILNMFSEIKDQEGRSPLFFFLLPPHLSFSSSFSKGLGPLLSLHTPAQPAGPQGTAHPAPGKLPTAPGSATP